MLSFKKYLIHIQAKKNRQRGMSYVELIVVLSIFSVLSAVVIYNYGAFQAKVDVKNLASDIALKIVEAQKSSVSGARPVSGVPSDWKPSYGIYFNIANGAGGSEEGDTNFIYFVDRDQDGEFDGLNCSDECIENIMITNGRVATMSVYYEGNKQQELNDVTISFVRPSTSAIIHSSTSFTDPVAYIEIIVTSRESSTAIIHIYPSGRVQVN